MNPYQRPVDPKKAKLLATHWSFQITTNVVPLTTSEAPKLLGPAEPVAAPINGWRVWRVVADGRLAPLSMMLAPLWVPGVQRAVHVGEHVRYPHSWSDPRVALPGCSCGFWAFKTEAKVRSRLSEFLAWTSDHMMVFGEVELWGRVVEHEQGYRGEFARIVGPLFIPALSASYFRMAFSNDFSRISEAYGVEIIVA